MSDGEWVLFSIGLSIIIFGTFEYLNGFRVRKTKKIVQATRWTAWVESVKDEDAERYAKSSFFTGIFYVVVGLMFWVGLIYSLLS